MAEQSLSVTPGNLSASVHSQNKSTILTPAFVLRRKSNKKPAKHSRVGINLTSSIVHTKGILICAKT